MSDININSIKSILKIPLVWLAVLATTVFQHDVDAKFSGCASLQSWPEKKSLIYMEFQQVMILCYQNVMKRNQRLCSLPFL